MIYVCLSIYAYSYSNDQLRVVCLILRLEADCQPWSLYVHSDSEYTFRDQIWTAQDVQ